MISPMLLFLAVVAVFFVAALVLVGRAVLRARSRSAVTWDQLLARLKTVDRRSVEHIALDLIEPNGGRRTDQDSMQLEPEQIWIAIGGMEGLNTIEHNSHVLIDIAAYLQQAYPEAIQTAEELRLTAREIQWNVGRLKTATGSGRHASLLGSNAQDAIAAYYLMTQRVLRLYQAAASPHLIPLQQAL